MVTADANEENIVKILSVTTAEEGPFVVSIDRVPNLSSAKETLIKASFFPEGNEKSGPPQYKGI